ncbi:hypothetical protein Pst134EA_025436 [Puccinia striiformis f. sp. tritici]|uniref:hypothetical protein n=1 Tax=Puccinia striiformis f. sp. tritici TaxID=168172 RepID=UPI0020086814|nr:hypothetical protein Pst134EA_025436 [Puccinia striiformis f. sp. tritici]KAH9451481.1 hypothetical protein Pst134EA_025436 [Puccinia striiformis f. sp. tritici]KAI9612981.1 hypothetical protein H4Q26_010252 [Puccinia striiformis f. sp. tritici PST-130]
MAARLAFTHAQKAQAASAYRTLIRSSKSTFNSDPRTYREFIVRAKELFSTKVLNPTYLLSINSQDPKPKTQSSGRSQTDHNDDQEGNNVLLPGRFEDEIQGVYELSKYLTRNIVQGKRSEDGKRLVLRFTDKTEVGDNSTIKNPSSTGSFLPTSGCCGGSHESSSDSSCSTTTTTTTTTTTPSRLSQAALERREKRRLNRQQSETTSASASS